ncbi:MAG: SIS domain-containing protein [Anaerolineales bacterium]|jgi:glucosamine--fructose-6-phosphate aminotransferase (isomerizing)
MENGYFTRQEIFSQPEAWTAAIKVFGDTRRDLLDLKPNQRFENIIFTGCGSTYYLSLAAAALTQEMIGLTCRAFPASELWLYPGSSFTAGKTLLIAVSRSGETTETLRACQAFLNGQRGTLLTLSCCGGMPLSKMGTFNLVLPSGQEQSVAQTRAFSTLYLGTVALACLWAGRDDLFASLSKIPEVGIRLLKTYFSLATELGQDAGLDRFYWLGSGPRLGLACELSLKMKEMSLSHSEPFHFMEFRHGPKSMVASSALTIGLCSSVNGHQEAAVLNDVKTLGGRVLALGEKGLEAFSRGTRQEVRFESGLDEAIRNVLYLPVGQLIAFERSLSKGLNPDLPSNLDAVVKLF